MGCTRARVRARGPTHPLCTRTPDDGLDEGGGWFLAEGRRERERGREGDKSSRGGWIVTGRLSSVDKQRFRVM